MHNRWIKQAVKDYVNKADLCLSDNKEIPDPKPTPAPWHLLDEEVREDNRSVVDHINIKLRSVFTAKDLDFFVDPGTVKIGFEFLKDDSIKWNNWPKWNTAGGWQTNSSAAGFMISKEMTLRRNMMPLLILTDLVTQFKIMIVSR